MSEPRFTPGEWISASRQGDDWDSVVAVADSPLEICQSFHPDLTFEGKEECEANTHLLSAAKDMYEALSQLSDGIGEAIHAGFRKACVSKESNQIYRLIADMPDEDYGSLIDFVLDGCGVRAALAKAVPHG